MYFNTITSYFLVYEEIIAEFIVLYIVNISYIYDYHSDFIKEDTTRFVNMIVDS